MFYSTFQKKYDNKRLASVDVSQGELRKGGASNMMYRDGLQPVSKSKLPGTAMMVKK